MAQKLQDIEKRLLLYKKGNHIPHVEKKITALMRFKEYST